MRAATRRHGRRRDPMLVNPTPMSFDGLEKTVAHLATPRDGETPDKHVKMKADWTAYIAKWHPDVLKQDSACDECYVLRVKLRDTKRAAPAPMKTGERETAHQILVRRDAEAAVRRVEEELKVHKTAGVHARDPMIFSECILHDMIQYRLESQEVKIKSMAVHLFISWCV